MRVILSRKGFDSSFGGCPSPILPDGTLLSLPIPEMAYSKDLNSKEERATWKTWENKQYKPLTYSDLQLPKSVVSYFKENDLSLLTYRDVLNELLPKGIIKENGEPYKKNLQWTCHFDPDIVPTVLVRSPEWQSLFGQGSGAATHLINNGVGENDLFLFFGWFKKTKLQDGKLIFDPNDKEGVHLIYGYLQVDYRISFTENRDKAKSWMSYHTHLRLKAWNNNKNAIYVGRKILTWDNQKPGAAVFQYHPSSVLTDTTIQNNPWKKRTLWRTELFPKDVKITYHKEKNYETKKDALGNISKFFRSNCRGQEFVFDESEKITEWAKKIIKA